MPSLHNAPVRGAEYGHWSGSSTVSGWSLSLRDCYPPDPVETRVEVPSPSVRATFFSSLVPRDRRPPPNLWRTLYNLRDCGLLLHSTLLIRRKRSRVCDWSPSSSVCGPTRSGCWSLIPCLNDLWLSTIWAASTHRHRPGRGAYSKGRTIADLISMT